MTDYTKNQTFANLTGQVIEGADFDAEFDEISTAIASKENGINRGAANGYAPLDGNSRVPTTNLPTNVQYLDSTAARTAAVNITMVGSHLSLYESDAGDTLDRALIELNSNALNLLVYDNSAATWRQALSCNVSTGALALGNGTTITSSGTWTHTGTLAITGGASVSSTLGIGGLTTIASGGLQVTGGIVVNTAGLTVSSGTTAVQALTATSATVAGSSVLTTASSIPETQIADGSTLARLAAAETITGNWQFSGTIKKTSAGGILYHASSTYSRGAITVSTADATGIPTNGDLWIKYTP